MNPSLITLNYCRGITHDTQCHDMPLGLSTAFLPDGGVLAMGYLVSFSVYGALHFASRACVGSDLINGTPRFNWFACGLGQVWGTDAAPRGGQAALLLCAVQVLVFPALVVAAWFADGGDAWSYFTGGAHAAAASATWEQTFLYAIAGQVCAYTTYAMCRV